MGKGSGRRTGMGTAVRSEKHPRGQILKLPSEANGNPQGRPQ